MPSRRGGIVHRGLLVVHEFSHCGVFVCRAARPWTPCLPRNATTCWPRAALYGHAFQDGRRTRRGGTTDIFYRCRHCPAYLQLRKGASGFVKAHGVAEPCKQYWSRTGGRGEPINPDQRSLLQPALPPLQILAQRSSHTYVPLDSDAGAQGHTARRYCTTCKRVSTYEVALQEPDAVPCQQPLDAGLPEVAALLTRLAQPTRQQ